MQHRKYSTILSCLSGLLLLSQLAYGQNAAATTTAAAAADDTLQLAGTCPLSSENFATTDFASVRTACDVDSMTSTAFCSSCVCGLGTAIIMGFDRAGIKINGQPVAVLAAEGDIDSLNALLTNCSAILGIELLQAGALTAQALGELANCNTTESTLDCANPAVDTTAAAPGMSAATSGAAGPEATAAQGSSQPPAAAAATATAPPAKSAAGGAGRSVAVVAAGVLLFVAAILA